MKIAILAGQMYPGNAHKLLEEYDEANSTSYG